MTYPDLDADTDRARATNNGGPGGPRAAWWLAAAVTLAAAVVPAVLWVGDVSFLQDEPRLLAKAFHANARGGIETHGLNGNFGVPYGPLPTHLYQLLLLVTHDPILIAGIRAALCAGVTAAGLLWLARGLRLNPWFAAAVVLAPYVWNFQRILWDASFAIPIGVIALAAYAAFLRTASRAALLASIACSIALAFIHPQDLPLLLPILAHALWRQRPALARAYVGIAVILGVTFALNYAYAREAYYAVRWQLEHRTMRDSYPGQERQSRAASTLKPLLGGVILSGDAFAANDSRLAEPRKVVRAARIASLVAYPLIWLGIVVASVYLVRRRRGTLLPGDDDADPTLPAARRAVFGIALAGLVLQMLLYGVMRMPVFPQYFFGTFVLHVLFAWIGVEALHRVRLHWAAIAVYGVSVAYITVASMTHVHRVGYARDTYRPSLANLVQVARELNRYADQTVMTDVHVLKAHPQSIRTLRLLLPPAGQPQTTSGRLIVRHRSGPTGDDSVIELAELAPDDPIPPNTEPLDVTPLPPNWHPAGW